MTRPAPILRRTIRHETETESGTRYRFRLRPTFDAASRTWRYEILEWRRRRPTDATFRRDDRQVGRIYTAEELRLDLDPAQKKEEPVKRPTPAPEPAPTPNPIDNFGDRRPKRVDPNDETVVVTVRVSATVAARLDERAKIAGLTRSAYLRRLLSSEP